MTRSCTFSSVGICMYVCMLQISYKEKEKEEKRTRKRGLSNRYHTVDCHAKARRRRRTIIKKKEDEEEEEIEFKLKK